jgi:excisionase family DNA binding protein
MKRAPVSSGPPPRSASLVAGPRLLRIDDVSERLAISRSMAWKLVSIGEIRSLRIGRAVRVRPEDLEEYLAGAEREL